MRTRTAALASAVVAAALLLAGCSGEVNLDPDPPSPPPTTESPRPRAEAQLPGETVLLASEDPSELALLTSRELFSSAQVVVLAQAGDAGSTARAASIATAFGVPVLLTGTDDGAVEAELVRLGVNTVVAVGEVDPGGIDTTGLVVQVAPDDAGDLSELLGTRVTDAEPVAPDGVVAALAALPAGEVLSLTDEPADPAEPASPGATSAPPAGTPAPGDAATTTEPPPSGTSTDGATPVPTADDTGSQVLETVGEMPETEPVASVEGVVVLADGLPAQAAAVGTARAAGAQVVVSAGDPRGSAAAQEVLPGATAIVGLGTTFADLETFTWQSATAATGTTLPGGGQLVFAGKRYVALYGSPVTPSLGVLGEQDTQATVERAAQFARLYEPLTDDTVVPALEIIVTVASGSAGDDGNYSNEWPSSEFVPLIEAAQAAGQYVVLDFQPGRTSFLDQVRAYEDLLAYPNVGIALDPEWRLGPDEVHLRQIGHVGIEEVNSVVTYLADFVRERSLPQKMIVLHQFQLRMIDGRERLDTSRTEVALLIHADGQGSQGAKAATWQNLHQGAPAGVAWGWKNFVDEDSPMLTPEQTYQVQPVPHFVSYQ